MACHIVHAAGSPVSTPSVPRARANDPLQHYRHLQRARTRSRDTQDRSRGCRVLDEARVSGSTPFNCRRGPGDDDRLGRGRHAGRTPSRRRFRAPVALLLRPSSSCDGCRCARSNIFGRPTRRRSDPPSSRRRSTSRLTIPPRRRLPDPLVCYVDDMVRGRLLGLDTPNASARAQHRQRAVRVHDLRPGAADQAHRR